MKTMLISKKNTFVLGRVFTILAVIVVLFNLSACRSDLDKIVSRESIGLIMDGIAAGQFKIPETALNAFESIKHMAMSREHYIDYLKQDEGSVSEILIERVVAPDEYRRQTDGFFNWMSDKQITYQKIIDEVEYTEELVERYKPEIEEESRKIDGMCSEIQQKIDEYETFLEGVDRKITLKIVNVEKASPRYGKAVAVKMRVTNAFKEPVHSVTFRVKVKDFEGNDVTSLTANIEEQVGPSYYTTLIYDQSFIVGPLLKKKYYEYTFDSEVSEVNIDGVLHQPGRYGNRNIDLPYGARYVMDHKYQSPEAPGGYCPYLSETDTEAQANLKKIEKKIQKQLEEEGYLFSKINRSTNVFRSAAE